MEKQTWITDILKEYDENLCEVLDYEEIKKAIVEHNCSKFDLTYDEEYTLWDNDDGPSEYACKGAYDDCIDYIADEQKERIFHSYALISEKYKEIENHEKLNEYSDYCFDGYISPECLYPNIENPYETTAVVIIRKDIHTSETVKDLYQPFSSLEEAENAIDEMEETIAKYCVENGVAEDPKENPDIALLLDETMIIDLSKGKMRYAFDEVGIDNKIDVLQKWEKAQNINGISDKQPKQKLKGLDIEIE